MGGDTGARKRRNRSGSCDDHGDHRKPYDSHGLKAVAPENGATLADLCLTRLFGEDIANQAVAQVWPLLIQGSDAQAIIDALAANGLLDAITDDIIESGGGVPNIPFVGVHGKVEKFIELLIANKIRSWYAGEPVCLGYVTK